MAETKRPDGGLSPEQLHQLQFSFVPAYVLTAGVQLGVYSHIAAGKTSVHEIAQAAETSPRGTRMLLDALVACQLLTQQNGLYGLTPLAAKYMVRSSPDYLGFMMEGRTHWEPWMNLVEVIRRGGPAYRVEEQQKAEDFFPLLVRSLHVMNREPAQRAAAVLGVGNPHRAMRVLDIACGSGVWSIAIAESDPQARLTAQDFPGMLSLTREYLQRHQVESQYDFLPGDLKEVDFGRDRYDLALVCNIVHSEGERSARDLFRRLFATLRAGGRIAIADMIPNESRTGPPFPVFFALEMLLHTEEGDTFSLSQYSEWLQQAGFSRVETAEIGSHSPLIIGCKP